MSGTALWLNVASLVLAVVAAALAASYAVDTWLERDRQRRAEQQTHAWPLESGRAWPEAEEEEEPTGAEEILAATLGPVVDRLYAGSRNLVAKTARATDGHRSIQLASQACVLGILACLAIVFFFPLLLIVALGYVSRPRHDIRLRVIVALFLVDLALQVIAEV